jgi:glucosamine 6-phosphate synthetase-like amidotransferase/phosphosugar isomerase protein
MLMAHSDISTHHRHHMLAQIYEQPAAIRNNATDVDRPQDFARSVVRE